MVEVKYADEHIGMSPYKVLSYYFYIHNLIDLRIRFL